MAFVNTAVNLRQLLLLKKGASGEEAGPDGEVPLGGRKWIAEGMKKEPVQTAPHLTLIQLVRWTAVSLKG